MNLCDIRIGTRLVSAFVLTSLLAVLVGIVGYSGIADTTAALSRTSRVDLPGLEALAQIDIGMRSTIVAQRTLLIRELSDKERATQYKDLETSRAIVSQGLAHYNAIPKSAEESRLAQELETDLAQADEQNALGFALIKDSEQDFSNEGVYNKAVIHIVNKANDANQKLFDSLERLIALTHKRSEQDRSKAEQEAAKDSWGMAVAAVLAPLLGILLGLLLTRSIAKPLASIVDFSESVAAGNLQRSLNIRQRDELGKLSDSLRIMVQALNGKISEADHKSNEAAEQARLAQTAMNEANEAKARAERAKTEGMIAAAAQLERVVEGISSASEELSAQVEQSSRGTEVQSTRVAETATAMEQMNSTVLEVARNASQAADSSREARDKALEGAKIVGQVVTGISTIQSVSQTLREDMSLLGKQAEDIGAIMNVISDIADQTNLLALNAAIEAARAGDAGRGFAVVADEVRKLAEKTMTATKEVGDAISGIQQGTKQNLENVEQAVTTIQQATSLAQQSGAALKEIVHLVEVSSDQVRSIATASEQQSATSEEINRSIEDINRISSETASAMNQSAQAVGELATQAGTLHTLIEKMKQAD